MRYSRGNRKRGAMSHRTWPSEQNCAIAQAAGVVGDWWSLLIVRDVTRGYRRFDELVSELGIARKVLTDRLHHLLTHGVLERQPYQQRPTRYEYRLTPRGQALLPVLVTLQDWGEQWLLGDGRPSATTTPRSTDPSPTTGFGGRATPTIRTGRRSDGVLNPTSGSSWGCFVGPFRWFDIALCRTNIAPGLPAGLSRVVAPRPPSTRRRLPVEAGESLRYRVLAGGGPILLDFDGPICSIFATYPAPAVADRLRAVLQAHGARVNGAAVSDPDPLEVLRWSATLGSDSIVRSVEDALREAEIHAASGADPTPFSRETILAAYRAGRLVGIASNNSADAIERYLTSQRVSIW